MASIRQCLTKLKEFKDEWGAYWRCKSSLVMGNSDFDRYYDELQPKTYEWTIQKLLIGIKRALQLYGFSRARDLLHTLKSKLSSWKIFLEPEIVQLKRKYEIKYYRWKARTLLRSEPHKAARIFWNKISDHAEDVELELKIASFSEGIREAMRRAQRYIDSASDPSALWRQVALLLTEKGYIPQANVVLTTHGVPVRFPRIDLLLMIIHLQIMVDNRETISAYLQRVDMSMLPRSELARFEFYRAFHTLYEIEAGIADLEKGMRTQQRKSEVDQLIRDVNNSIKIILDNEPLIEYEQQLEEVFKKYTNAMISYHRIIGRTFDSTALVKNILQKYPNSEFALQFLVVSFF